MPADAIKNEAMEMVAEHILLAEPIVFLLGLGESIAVVSLFIPSTALFLGIGGLHAAAGGDFLALWLAGALGAFLGDVISFASGRYLKDEVRNYWPFSTRPHWYVMTRIYTRRRGAWGIILGKFLGAMRPFIPVVAGAAGMTWVKFLIASPVSCLLWAGLFLGIGHGVFAML